MVFLISCKKQKTVWDSNWNLPLVNDTLSLNQLVLDSVLVEDTDGNYRLYTEKELLNLSIVDLIEFPDTTLYLPYSISFNQLNLPPGTTIQGDVEEHDFSIPDVELKKLRMSNGLIDILIQNPLSYKVSYIVNMPGVTKNNIMFSRVYEVPPGTAANPGTKTAEIDISGYDMDLTGTGGGKFNLLQTKIDVATDPLGGVVSLTKFDTIKIFVELKDIKVDYARGYLGNQLISDTIETRIDALSSLSSGLIDFSKASISLNIENGLKIPAKANLISVVNVSQTNTLNLSSNGQNGFAFGTPFNLDPATGSWNSLVSSYRSLLFNETNSNLIPYIQNLGVIQKIGYAVELNPWGNTSGGWNEVFASSRLKINMLADIPLKIGLDQLTLLDTFDFSIQQNKSKTHLKSLDLLIKSSNGFPYSGQVSFQFLNKNKEVLGQVNASQEIKSSLYGNLFTPKNVQYSLSELNVALSENLINQFDEIAYVVVKTIFNSPDPNDGVNKQFSIPAGAFLGIKIFGNINLLNSF